MGSEREPTWEEFAPSPKERLRLLADRNTRCLVSLTRPPRVDDGRWWDGGFHHCRCGAVVQWTSSPTHTGGVVSEHAPRWGSIDAEDVAAILSLLDEREALLKALRDIEASGAYPEAAIARDALAALEGS